MVRLLPEVLSRQRETFGGQEIMRALVRVKLTRAGEEAAGQGAIHELGHGDIIGRLETAALWIDDPNISEAHALVSLRDHEFKLLALRGRFAIDDQPSTRTTLRAGLRIALARDVTLEVIEVVLPDLVMAIEGDGLPTRMLPPVCWLTLDPRPTLVPRLPTDTPAPGAAQSPVTAIWSTGDHWSYRIGNGPNHAARQGEHFEVAGRRFTFSTIRLSDAPAGTTLVPGQIGAPLRIVVRWDSVHIHRPGEEPLSITGVQARLMTELCLFDGPVDWEVAAGEVWEPADRITTRARLDTTLARLRRTLRQARIRPDLIRADGHGNLEVVRYPNDEVIDES